MHFLGIILFCSDW